MKASNNNGKIAAFLAASLIASVSFMNVVAKANGPKEVSSEWAFALANDANNFQEKDGVIVAKVVDKDYRDYALRQSPASQAVDKDYRDYALRESVSPVSAPSPAPAEFASVIRTWEYPSNLVSPSPEPAEFAAAIREWKYPSYLVSPSPAPAEFAAAIREWEYPSAVSDKDYRDYALRESVSPVSAGIASSLRERDYTAAK